LLLVNFARGGDLTNPGLWFGSNLGGRIPLTLWLEVLQYNRSPCITTGGNCSALQVKRLVPVRAYPLMLARRA